MKRVKRRRKITYTSHDKERCTVEELASDDERFDFERDRSRIIHSAAFRRLQGKTQVFSTGEGDFWRTRLTHSLEVAQIGKGLALRLGADTDLVEAVSLIHDIGHPPFGHAGERELQRLMKPYGGFEANAQNVRIITKLESKSQRYDGLNLTRAVIDGQMKYKKSFDRSKDKVDKERSDSGQHNRDQIDKNKFVYENDLKLVEWASKEARTTVTGSSDGWKSFECEIMDWADEVAYAVHDLEDSIHTGYIDARTLNNKSLISDIIAKVKEKFEDCAVDVTRVCEELIELIRQQNPDFRPFVPVSSPRQQKANRKGLTSYLIGRYIKHTVRAERGEANDEPISYRYLYTVQIPIEYRVEVSLINRLIRKLVIESPQIRALEEKGKHIIRCLFLKFMRENNADYLLPYDWKGYLEGDDSRQNRARVVSDYISGMTDDYAQKTYAKLFMPNYGSVYEVL